MTDEPIVHGLSFGDYCGADGWAGRMSASAVSHGLVSMLELRAFLDGDLAGGDSPAMAFGRAYHCRLLEPERFDSDYAVWPDFASDPANIDTKGKQSTSAATVWVKTRMKIWEAEHCGQERLSCADADAIDAMNRVVRAHPVVKLLRAKGGAEVSIRGELCGLPCKARLDRLQDDNSLIIDLKKTRSLATHSLERAILEYDYHVKAAFYRDLLHAITGRWASWLWLFQQDKPPYDVRPWQPPDDDLECGRSEYRGVLSRYKHCLKTGVWPGMAQEIEHYGLPEWRRRQWQQSGERSDWDG